MIVSPLGIEPGTPWLRGSERSLTHSRDILFLNECANYPLSVLQCLSSINLALVPIVWAVTTYLCCPSTTTTSATRFLCFLGRLQAISVAPHLHRMGREKERERESYPEAVNSNRCCPNAGGLQQTFLTKLSFRDRPSRLSTLKKVPTFRQPSI